MPQVRGLESKREVMPCPAALVIRVCAQGVCAAVEDDGTSLTHPLPSAPQWPGTAAKTYLCWVLRSQPRVLIINGVWRLNRNRWPFLEPVNSGSLKVETRYLCFLKKLLLLILWDSSRGFAIWTPQSGSDKACTFTYETLLMLMNYVFTLDSVFKSVPPETQNQLDKPVCFTHVNVLLSYVNETCICLEICLSSKFMSIILWPGTAHLVPMSGWGAWCHSLSFETFSFSN